ncbi:MCE family protein [Aeromicrobium sp. CTD01-1L150]|uniref:MCE family protein n=1 Tax=Aeromicrobium sp. CTD01-1L150 TaxID=3341830 RepID=UPI0035C1FE52
MKPFRERNLAVIGLLGFAVIGAMLLAAFRADQLPIIGAGEIYHAEFAEIGGLRDDAEVRVAGITVGKVQSIDLEGNKVNVTFKIDKGTQLGQETGAEIKLRTLLGAQFLALTPNGSGDLDEGDTIPVDRTVPPYDVVEAFSDLTEVNEALDKDQIAAALETLGDVAAETPEEFRGAIQGVSDLSENLVARDEQINTLLVNLKKVSGVLNSRNEELETLFEDASVLFDALSSRRESINRLLVSTQEISAELQTLVEQTRADLNPALTRLERVTDMLKRNQDSLDAALTTLPAFLRVFSNALGTGPWFETYVQIGGDNN